MKKPMLLFPLMLPIWLSAAPAHECGTASYDQTEPRAIRSQVSDHVGKFEWMTDIEVINGQSWLCNCILNHHEKGWTGRWQKAGINVPIGKPVAKDRDSCREIFLGKHRDDPDKDAPIVYGATNEKQLAVVFTSEDIDENEKQGFWSFRFSSAYQNEIKSIEQFSVSGSVSRKDGGIFAIDVQTTSDIYVAIDNVDRVISPNTYAQIKELSDQLIFVPSLAAWTEGKLDLNPLDLPKDSSVIFTGSAIVDVKTDKIGPTPTTNLEILIFDKNRELLLSGEVKLPTL